MVTYSPMLDLLSRTAALIYAAPQVVDTKERAVLAAADIIRLADEHLRAAHVLRLDPPTEGMAVLGHFASEED